MNDRLPRVYGNLSKSQAGWLLWVVTSDGSVAARYIEFAERSGAASESRFHVSYDEKNQLYDVMLS